MTSKTDDDVFVYESLVKAVLENPVPVEIFPVVDINILLFISMIL
jgi:hypothetical protein